MIAYIREYADRFGVEPICAVLAEHEITIAPSTYWAHAKRGFGPTNAELDDAYAANELFDLWVANRRLYGRRKLWKTAHRAGKPWGRDQVERLMKILGVDGVRRGKRHTITTQADPKAPRHPDHIKRQWGAPTAPDTWWVADFTYVWTPNGFCYVSFVTDVFSRRILGWRVTTSKTTPLVLSALEGAMATRRRSSFEFTTDGLLHHSDAGSQHVAGVHRGPDGGRDHRLDRHRRRRPGQRADGIHDRAVQDRGHLPRTRDLAHVAPSRTSHRQLGLLVQPPATPLGGLMTSHPETHPPEAQSLHDPASPPGTIPDPAPEQPSPVAAVAAPAKGRSISRAAWLALVIGAKQARARAYRGQIPSPGAPTVAWREDRVRFWSFTTPMGVAMLFAAIAGALITAMVGTVRMVVLGRNVRRLQRERSGGA